MSNFENDPFSPKQPIAPESFESQSHLILRNPTEIDLNQPDRAPELSMEAVTGFVESKLIAEIKTPTDHIGVIHTQIPNLDPVIMIVGRDKEAKLVLDPGDVIDLSGVGEKGKCIMTIDESGQHLFVHAENPDPAYQIFTRELEQFVAPSYEDNMDDPEMPSTISHS